MEKKTRIALLGLITEDPSLYRKGAFGDCKITPLEESALQWFDVIHEREAANGGVDAIIPLTHQVMPFDRQLAKSSAAAKKKFPIIIGGHDHEPYFEDVESCKIVKTGMDGTKIAIIELLWLSKAATKPDVSVQIVDAKKFEPDPVVLDVVNKHLQLLQEVMKTQLFTINTGEGSKNTLYYFVKVVIVGCFIISGISSSSSSSSSSSDAYIYIYLYLFIRIGLRMSYVCM